MSYEATAVFRDSARLRLTLTGRGAFSSTKQRARWAACDALGAVPGEHTGPIDRVEITRAGRVVERVERLNGYGRIQIVEVVRQPMEGTR